MQLLRIDSYNEVTMNDPHNGGNDLPLQNDSERFGTVPNEEGFRSEEVRNDAEPFGTMRNERPESSEHVRNGSEPAQKSEALSSERVPHPSEPFGTLRNEVQNGSEDVRNASEPFGTVPHESAPSSAEEPLRAEWEREPSASSVPRAPRCGPEHEGLTITVREAARIFEESGVPRTERAITNWCNPNGRGIVRLDCCYHEGERKYYISPQSLQQAIVEERKKMQFLEYRDGRPLSFEAEQLSDHLRAEHDRQTEADHRPDPTPAQGHQSAPHRDTTKEQEPAQARPEPIKATETSAAGETPASLSEAEREELKELRLANFELRVQLEGQKYLIRQFDDLAKGERERHERETMTLVDRLTDARHQIGSLEQKLLQLEAPRGAVRDVELSSHDDSRSWREAA